MLKRARSLNLVLLLASAAAVSAAFAQGTPPAPEAPAKEDDDDEVVPPNDRLVSTASELLTSMRASHAKGLEEVKEARESRDAVQLTCVNEPVTAMKGLLRVSEDANIDLQEALTEGDSETAAFHFKNIARAKKKMDDLLQEAVNCAGASASESNASVDLEVDPSLTNLDAYYGNQSFFFDPQDALVDGDTGTVGDDDPSNPRPPVASGVR